jgi:spore maturation protein A
MSLVWVFMVAAGCVTALLTGRVDAMMSAVLGGVRQAVELVIGLTGVFCLWVGVERLAEEAGLVDALARLASPVFGALFPYLRAARKPLGTVTASVLSNVLGLSSSTPLGLKAMSEMKDAVGEGGQGLDSMSTLVILNAAGFCLFPSTIIALRAALGSRAPALIAGPTAVAGLAATFGGLLAYRLLGRAFREG